MAKKKQKPKTSSKKKSTSPTVSKKAKVAKKNWVNWAYGTSAPVGQNSDIWKKAYMAILVLGSLFILALSFPTGINADEKFQDNYAEKLVDYYASFGADKAALYEGDQSSNRYNRFYGGFFELVTGGVNRILGNKPGPAYHQVRHFFNALVGMLPFLFTVFWARQMGGRRAGIFAAILLLASPRLLGHGVMNPKDIPFAAGYLIAGYYLYRCLVTMPKPRWQDGLGFVLGAALAMATRAGGILIFCYSGLFLGIDFLLRYGVSGIFQRVKDFGKYAGYWIGSTLAAFGLGILFWPYALQAPIAHTKEALELFSQYAVRIIILFGGENMYSDAIPANYPLVWLMLTLAISVLIGIIASVVLVGALGKRFGRLPLLLALFIGFFPLAYIMIKDSALYDGWRQLLFIYPSLVVAAALFYEWLAERLQGVSWGQYAVWGVLILFSADALAFSVRNPGYTYVYFNPLAGGVKGAFGEYELDYWGLSTKQAIDWMEDEGILHENMTDTLIIGTTFAYNIQRQLDPSYKSKVKVQYVRFHRRYNERWDYGIFPSRFIRGPQLRSGNWPNSKTVHTIKANGVPLTAIEHDPQQFVMQAEALAKSGQPQQAIAFYQQEVEVYPDNEQAWTGMASSYAALGQADNAIEATNRALEAAPDNETALYLRGYGYLLKNDPNQAEQEFDYLITVDPENAMAYYMKGEIYRQRNDLQNAVRSLQTAIKYNPRLKQAYLLMAQIFESQGDTQNANRFREAANQL